MPSPNRSVAHVGGRSASGGDAGALALAFQRIYDERFEHVACWVRALGGRSSDIPDLVHDVFVVAYRRLPDFDDQNVSGWLYQVTRRRMRGYHRLSWIKLLFTERTPKMFARLVGTGLEPLLESILNTLPGEQRAAFMLFEVEGYSGMEIAELQQVALSTVWARIHEARQKLQSRLRVSRTRAR